MKKIIDGKKYSTNTSKMLAIWKQEKTETLYRKDTGEFFLHISETNIRQIAPTEKITPIGESTAKMWAEQHVDCDHYESIFGEIIDGI